jgi:glycerol-3-phosphate O-acyltransferase/dihydroxyacetone phosphate acyltransferase
MAGFPVGKFTALDSKEGFAHATTKIREAMRERGEMRRRKSQAQRGFEMVDENGATSDETESLEGSVVDLREKKET